MFCCCQTSARSLIAHDASAIRWRQSGMELLLTILCPRYVNSETPSTLCPLTVIQLAGGRAPTFCTFVFMHGFGWFLFHGFRCVRQNFWFVYKQCNVIGIVEICEQIASDSNTYANLTAYMFHDVVNRQINQGTQPWRTLETVVKHLLNERPILILAEIQLYNFSIRLCNKSSK